MLLSKNKLIFLLSVAFILATLTYVYRFPTGDDAWFAEQSYWLQKMGIIRSDFFEGILGWDKQLLVSHKLFLLFGAGLIKLFGYQLPVVQFVGLIFFYIMIFEICLYVSKKEKAVVTLPFIFLLILIFTNRLLVKMSFENRPELMLAALGFGSFLFLQRREISYFAIAFSGFLAGLALLTHLNGVIYMIAGAGTLFLSKRYRELFVFSIVSGMTGAFYFLDVFMAKNGFVIWYYQFRNDPAVQSAFGVKSKLFTLLTYPNLFFESPEQAALSLLLLFLLWNQRKLIHRLPATLKVYTIILVVSFWMITKRNSGLYLVIFIPFMLILIYELYKMSPFINSGLKFVLILYFSIGVYGIIEIIIKNFNNEYLPISYRKLQTNLPKKLEKERGLVPMTFFFNEYENFSHLISYENFFFSSPNLSNSADDLAKWADRRGISFILMDYKFRPESFYPTPGTKSLQKYRLGFFDGRFAVYLKSSSVSSSESNLSMIR